MGAAARDTATFTPYWWEAYNEITRPDRWDWYLIEKWQRDLGPIGFSIVKTLRHHCYHNAKKGALRDTCEIAMGELAESIGISRATLFREMERNEALKQFVRIIPQYQPRGNKIERTANRFQVCMDTPIHPDDMARYDELRCQKEADRDAPKEGKGYILKPALRPESQIEIQVPETARPESQFATRESQSETGYIPSQIETAIDSLPSGGLITKESLTPEAGAHKPPINPPEGESPEGKAWAGVLAILASQVESGEINIPTWHGHLTRLCLHSLTETEHPGGTRLQAVIVAPSAFTRDWVEKRQGERIRAALACATGREVETVTIEFSTEEKYHGDHA